MESLSSCHAVWDFSFLQIRGDRTDVFLYLPHNLKMKVTLNLAQDSGQSVVGNYRKSMISDFNSMCIYIYI